MNLVILDHDIPSGAAATGWQNDVVDIQILHGQYWKPNSNVALGGRSRVLPFDMTARLRLRFFWLWGLEVVNQGRTYLQVVNIGEDISRGLTDKSDSTIPQAIYLHLGMYVYL